MNVHRLAQFEESAASPLRESVRGNRWFFSQETNTQERRASVIQGHAHAAQLRALHSQVNPHVLFNRLNSIAALIDGEQGRRAEEMATRLAAFFRSSLPTSPLEDVLLTKEKSRDHRVHMKLPLSFVR